MPAPDRHETDDGKVWVIDKDAYSAKWVATCGDIVESVTGKGRMGLVVYLQKKYKGSESAIEHEKE